MIKFSTSSRNVVILLLFSFFTVNLKAQQLKATDFVIFGGQNPSSSNIVSTPPAPGFSVVIGSGANVTKGRIGSYNLITSTGSSKLASDLNSGGTINLTNSSTVIGNITAQNKNNASGNSLQIGSNAFVKYNIDVNGNIFINSGSVEGNVTHPFGTTYSGPKPGGSEYIKSANIPILPAFPAITNFTINATADIKGTQVLKPGYYANMKLGGNQKITFGGPGDYFFKSIHNRNSNVLEFDFKGTAKGNIRIFVEGDVELDKSTSSLKNGGSASRIFLEVHGKGTTTAINAFSFTISNGASNSSAWLGTVWAPYAAINIGSGTGSSYITGAVWSTTQVNIHSGVNMIFAPFEGWNADTLIVPGYNPPVTGKTNDLIGPELKSLCENFKTGIAPSPDIYRIIDQTVFVEVVANAGYYNQALAKLRDQYGMTDFVDNGPNTLVITGKIPIDQLCILNDDTDLKTYVNSFRPVYPPIASTGLATTGGDSAMHSYIVRNAFHLTGEGIQVGVLSDGYNTIPGNPAATDIANGDLPGTGNPVNSTPVNVVSEYPYGRTTDEGRAMLQVVHDIAPKATLSFRTGFVSEGDFAQGIYQLQQAGCKVITDDITYITTPFFKDGLAAKAVNTVKELGVSYFSAGGNFGAKSYEAIFNPAPAPTGVTGQAHNFGGGDIFQNDSLQPGSYTIVMQWEDSIYSLGQGGAHNDFDIYLTNDDGSILFGMNRPNLGADPVEVLPFFVRANTRTNIMVIRAAGTGNVRFKFIVYRGELKFNEFATGDATLVGQANAEGAMAVAAARYTRTPQFGVNPPLVETFSSKGGVMTNGIVRNKPDFTAPDGGNSTVNFGSIDLEGDGVPNFFGTSAAAPHAAGVAALLLQGKNRFYGKVLEPDSVRIILQNTAWDMATPGFDNFTGSGLIQADSAVGSFAAPTPKLDSLLISGNSSVPGKTLVTVTMKGKYFRPNTKVTVRGIPVSTQILNSSLATAVINPFEGNPPIQMFTPPITPSKLDGSYSDPLYFFSRIKKKVVITAENKTKKYGEELPVFSSQILVDGVTPEVFGLSLSDLKLDTIVYATPATSNSNVGLYFIRPSFKSLSAEDSLAFELYDYTFKDGILFNNKMPLIISPKDTTITYGDKISDLSYIYTYGDSLIPLAERNTFLNNIDIVHNSTVNNNVVAFVDSKSIINGRTLTDADLLNMGVMASSKSIINARNIINGKSIINGVEINDTTKVIDLALQSIFDYQIDSSSSPLVNAKNIVNARAIINAKSIINGTAEVNSKSIINGSTILNSNSLGDTSNNNVIVIIDQTDVPAETNVLSDFKSVNLITGTTAGDFLIVPAAMVSENFEIRYALGHLKILPAKLSVKALDTLIYQGDTLPEFTSETKGLKNRDSVLSGPSYTLDPAYFGSAGTYTITPSNVILDCPECYTITYTSGTLYVDPKGKNAKNLKPYLVCVDTIQNDPTGLKYVATFGCKNDNATLVYVPVGPNNFLSGAGAAKAVGNLPRYFKPGGDNTFQIKFDGRKLIWTVKSYNVYQNTAVAQEASSSSQRCKKAITISSAISGSNNLSEEKTVLMPNPAKSKFVISSNKEIIADKDLFVSDVAGKKYAVKANKLASTAVEIELPSNISSGIYFVKVKVGNEYRVFKVIKL